MAAIHQRSSELITGINVTPLVDVTLVLLVVFIVTAKLIVTPAIPLDLPRASHTDALQTVLAVSVPASGPVAVNGQAVLDDRDIARLARTAVQREPALRAIIAAEGDVPHRRVIQLLDLIKSAGIARIAFGALPDEPEGR